MSVIIMGETSLVRAENMPRLNSIKLHYIMNMSQFNFRIIKEFYTLIKKLSEFRLQIVEHKNDVIVKINNYDDPCTMQ